MDIKSWLKDRMVSAEAYDADALLEHFLSEMQISHRFEEYPVGHGVSGENFDSFRRWLAGKY